MTEEKKQIVKQITQDIMLAVYTDEYPMGKVPDKIAELVSKAYDLGCREKKKQE